MHSIQVIKTVIVGLDATIHTILNIINMDCRIKLGYDKKDKITYFQVDDFSLDCIPSNSLDYVFSYDVFCHISYPGQREYLKNL